MSADPAALDAADPLARFRAEFFLPPGKIYLDGNSLGLLSRRAETHLARVVAEGTVTVPASRIEMMYDPARFGLSPSQTLTTEASPDEAVAGR